MSGYSKSSIRIAISIFFTLSGAALAEDWKSPGGGIAVIVPDPARFVEEKDQPPDSIGWKSKDKRLLFMVGQDVAPKPGKLQLSLLVEEFTQHYKKDWNNFAIIKSAMEIRGGNEVFIISARGEMKQLPIYVTDITLAIRGKVYKAGVVGFGVDATTDPDAIAFVASIRPLISSQSVPTASVGPAPPTPDQLRQVQQSLEDESAAKSKNVISWLVGAVLILGLLLIVIAIVVHRSNRSRNTDGGGAKSKRRRRKDEDEDD